MFLEAMDDSFMGGGGPPPVPPPPPPPLPPRTPTPPPTPSIAPFTPGMLMGPDDDWTELPLESPVPPYCAATGRRGHCYEDPWCECNGDGAYAPTPEDESSRPVIERDDEDDDEDEEETQVEETQEEVSDENEIEDEEAGDDVDKEWHDEDIGNAKEEQDK